LRRVIGGAETDPRRREVFIYHYTLPPPRISTEQRLGTTGALPAVAPATEQPSC
jgi:hypothetical protein